MCPSRGENLLICKSKTFLAPAQTDLTAPYTSFSSASPIAIISQTRISSSIMPQQRKQLRTRPPGSSALTTSRTTPSERPSKPLSLPQRRQSQKPSARLRITRQQPKRRQTRRSRLQTQRAPRYQRTAAHTVSSHVGLPSAIRPSSPRSLTHKETASVTTPTP